jgi:NADP-dependent 3-hydroxy acid dehydrogenase YdfG
MEAIRNQVIAITGASSGIGMATAQVLAGMGARLVIGARRTDKLDELAARLRQQGAQVITAALDVRQRASVQNFVDLAVQTYGHIDVLVNNAGVMPLSRMSVGKVDEWEDTIDINVKGVLYGIAAALPRMKAQGAGHLISVASIGAHHAFPGAAVYCGSRSGPSARPCARRNSMATSASQRFRPARSARNWPTASRTRMPPPPCAISGP